MSEATADAAAGKGGKSKAKLLIIAGIVLAVLLAGGGAAAFLLSKKGHDDTAAAADEGGEEEHAAPKPKKKAKKAKADHPPIFVQLDPFTVNLADTEADRFAQIQFVLEASDKAVDDEVKNQLPAVRNAILLLLSSKTSRELLTMEGKEKLAAEVLAATAKRIGEDRVESVHFAQFIVQ